MRTNEHAPLTRLPAPEKTASAVSCTCFVSTQDLDRGPTLNSEGSCMVAMTPGLVRSSTPPFQFQKKRRTFRLLNCRAENYSQILRSSVSDVATCVVHCKGKLWHRK
jgi:hypothetical protein